MVALPRPPEPARAAAGLAARLERLGRAYVERGNAIYSRRARSTFDWRGQTFTWAWELARPAPRASELIGLASPAGKLWLALANDASFDADRDLDWRALGGEARLAAWTLRYEPVVRHLSRLFGVDAEPYTILRFPRDRLDVKGYTRLDFAICDGGPGVSLRGALLVADGMRAPAAGDSAPPPIDPRFDPIALRFRIVLPGPAARGDAIAGLEAGDLIALGSAARIRDGAPLALEAPGLRLAAALHGASLRVSGVAREERLPRLHGRRSAMSGIEANPPARLVRDDALNGLQVTLAFEVGELTLSVGELRALAPGYVCPLGRRLEDAPVTVRANGDPVARGELVLVDDFVAVRIVEVLAHGRD